MRFSSRILSWNFMPRVLSFPSFLRRFVWDVSFISIFHSNNNIYAVLISDAPSDGYLDFCLNSNTVSVYLLYSFVETEMAMSGKMSFQQMSYVSSTELIHSKWDTETVRESNVAFNFLLTISLLLILDYEIRFVCVRACACERHFVHDLVLKVSHLNWKQGSHAHMNVTVKQTTIRMILNFIHSYMRYKTRVTAWQKWWNFDQFIPTSGENVCHRIFVTLSYSYVISHCTQRILVQFLLTKCFY